MGDIAGGEVLVDGQSVKAARLNNLARNAVIRERLESSTE
jgi:hypothetical protein